MLKKYWQVSAIFTDTDTTSRYHKNRPIPPIPILKYRYITSHNLENIIADKIVEHLINNNLLSASQFGFLPGQSTCTQLLTALNKWYNSYDQGINIDIVYTDISKGFDTVSHHKLLGGLKSYGIVNKILNLIHAFLSDRTQCVCINNAFSSFLSVTSGVPQGSVLGPLLFIIFINNMSIFCHPKHPLSGMLLYADDAKLFSTDHIDL